LCDKYDETFKEVLLDNKGNVRDYLKVMLNGEDIRDLGLVETFPKRWRSNCHVPNHSWWFNPKFFFIPII
jgi:hypothetical protein